MSDADIRGVKGRLASEIKMFIIDVGEMKIDPDTADFVADNARRLVPRVEEAVSDRDLTKVESDLGRLQVVVHQALKRTAGASMSAGEPESEEGSGSG